MPIDTVEHEQGVIINVSGIFDRGASDNLEDVIRAEARKGKNLVINLYDVNYISSVSIGTLVKLHTDLADSDVDLAVSNISDECKRIFDMVEVGQVIPIYEDDDSAFHSMSAPSDS